MKEDKRAICEALLPVLQMTRQLNDLTGLEYSSASPEGVEYVTALFREGRKVINVSGDSGIAMISDIISRLGS